MSHRIKPVEEITFICQVLNYKLADFGLSLEKGNVATIPKNLAQSSKTFMDALRKGILKVVSPGGDTVLSPEPKQDLKKEREQRNPPSNQDQQRQQKLRLSPITQKSALPSNPNKTVPSITIQSESSFLSDSHLTDLKECISKENSSVKDRLNAVEVLFSAITKKIDKSLDEISFIKESLKKDLNLEIKDVIHEFIFPIQKTLTQLSSVFETEAVEIIDKRKVFDTVKLVVSECLESMNSIDYVRIEDIIEKIIQKNMEKPKVSFLQEPTQSGTRIPVGDAGISFQETFIPGSFNDSGRIESENNGVSKTSKKKR